MEHSNEELSNILIQSIIAKDQKLLQSVLDIGDEEVIKDVITKVPVNYVMKLLVELSNLISDNTNLNHLTWLQHLLSIRYSVVTTMTEGRSILLPLLSVLKDKSSPEYYAKMQSLKGKITLLRNLRETASQ